MSFFLSFPSFEQIRKASGGAEEGSKAGAFCIYNIDKQSSIADTSSSSPLSTIFIKQVQFRCLIPWNLFSKYTFDHR